MTVTNTLAYYEMATITAVRSFIVLGLGVKCYKTVFFTDVAAK